MAVPKKKKTTNAKPSDAPSTLHPPYFQMISEAITSLKDRTGSSQPAIAKFIEDKYRALLPPNFKKMLSIQLRKFVKSEKLFKVKNSYKISEDEKVKFVAVSIKQSQKKKVNPTSNVPKKKGEKTKSLSQLKTPEALKKNSAVAKKVVKKDMKKSVVTGTGGKKMKRLSQVKTPDRLKKKKVSTPVKRKSSRPASKKPKK
uniref:Putative histone H1 n=1 Tax=Davidia involucrata TaxID=16924 RepID=A0A5B7CB14_DAVIN